MLLLSVLGSLLPCGLSRLGREQTMDWMNNTYLLLLASFPVDIHLHVAV